MRETIDTFLAAAREPAVIEPGEDPIRIVSDNFVLETRGERLTLECWSTTKNLVRRVRGVKDVRRGRLELEVEKFGGRRGELVLADLAHPSYAATARRGGRLKFREQFRLFLRRQYADWKVAELSTDPDLTHSLSPSYPRALLRKGRAAVAAIGASEEAGDIDGALSFGLIWLDYLRKREPKLAVGGLSLYLPAGEEMTTCHRIRCLDAKAAQFEVFVYGTGIEEAVDPAGYTNFATRLTPYRAPVFDVEVQAWAQRLAAVDGVDARPLPNGAVSLGVRGIEFARATETGLTFGLTSDKDDKHAAGASHIGEIEALARGIARLRNRDAVDRTNPLYTRHPEAWLESQVRAHIDCIDASLLPGPIYGQAPEFAAASRSILDLLAVDRHGRLAVIEVKASADIHLPLQALDYWARVKWHLERSEFAGYFPGVALRVEAPRLYLVAPALEFHPSNTTVLRFFAPEIEVTRVGVGLEWRRELKAMFRAAGAEAKG